MECGLFHVGIENKCKISVSHEPGESYDKQKEAILKLCFFFYAYMANMGTINKRIVFFS